MYIKYGLMFILLLIFGNFCIGEEERKEPVKYVNDVVLSSEIDIDSNDSIQVIINKNRPLDKEYYPSDLVIPNVSSIKEEMYLREEAAHSLEEMFEYAEKEEINLLLISAFRSYDYQENLYKKNIANDANANRYSAKPGESEHQTGLAVDLSSASMNCLLEECFESTKEGVWLNENAHLFGFILRYPKEKEPITGYIFEPWHFRYIGKVESLKVYNSKCTLEEYYGLISIF